MNAQANIKTLISIDNKAIIQSTLGRISLVSTLVVSSLPNSPSENLIKKTSDMISNAGSELLDWFDELTIHTNFVRNGITAIEEIRLISVLVKNSAPLNLSKKIIEKTFSQIRAMSDAMLDELDKEEVLA